MVRDLTTGFLLGICSSILAMHGWHLFMRHRLARVIQMTEEEALLEYEEHAIAAQEAQLEEEDEDHDAD